MGESAESSSRIAAPPDNPQIVAFPVEVDISNASYVRSWLLEALEEHPKVVIADMRLTEFCDTTCISCLILASKRMADAGTELRVVVTSANIRRVMDILGIQGVLALYSDMDAAITGQPAA